MTRNMTYKPPFPYFGGKSAVADVVWRGLGDVTNYVEPFFGSGAVLMLRPGGAGKVETVNDADGLVANFWRAMQHDAEAVAFHADWPVSACDLHARHLWLVGNRERITDHLCGDPDWFDAKAAGWWCWGCCCWIGSGWCSGNGPWIVEDGKMVLGDAGRGVNRQLPHLGGAGRGVSRQRGERLVTFLGEFAERLRYVRVTCGDWSSVCGESVTVNHGLTGVFLDPPYADTAGRDSGLYAVDCLRVAHDVCEWAVANGDNPLLRIVLAGYEGEYDMPESWRVHEWRTAGGYGSQGKGKEGKGRQNKTRERLWFSPHCIDVRERLLFA